MLGRVASSFVLPRLAGRDLFLHIFFGAVLGILILHPVTTLVYWYEFVGVATSTEEGPMTFLLQRLVSAFYFEMLPMSLVFALIGGGLGLAFGVYHFRLLRERRTVQFLEHELAEELPLLVDRGEGEQIEFKSSLRWDRRQQRVNRDLQYVCVKAVAGFLNHEGGTLLIGIEDDGSVAGIEADIRTLRHRNTDGFERLFMDAARDRLGGSACALIHCRFHDVDTQTVCRVIVEKSHEPIYYTEDGVARLLLRVGNSTRELDVREAHSHFNRRKRTRR